MHLYVKIFVFLLELIKRCLNFTLLLLFLSPKSEWHVHRLVCVMSDMWTDVMVRQPTGQNAKEDKRRDESFSKAHTFKFN